MNTVDPGGDQNQELVILRGAIENTNEGFVTIDEKHRVVIFNRAAERILGISREEILGRDLSLVLTSECRQGHRAAVTRYLQTREPRLIGHQSEFLTKRRNGESFPLSISFSVSAIGGKTFFTGIIQDLTETKALQAQVLESGRLAALGQLAAEVSHEIKNPLIMIGGFARQLLRSVQEPQSRNKLQIIADEVARLETLIGELRDLYRPRPLELEAVDLRALLEEIHALIRDDSKDRNVEAVLDLPTDPLIVQGDRNKLKQVILNLVRNGIEAMDHGGTLTIRAHCTPERLEISVTDEGGGIPEADREKIFVPFYTTKKHGTGLGLSLSKRIIEEHAGYSFSLTSGQEKGAVARITMPAAVCELPAGGSSPAPKTRKRRKK